MRLLETLYRLQEKAIFVFILTPVCGNCEAFLLASQLNTLSLIWFNFMHQNEFFFSFLFVKKKAS